jgi:hypothetical protein
MLTRKFLHDCLRRLNVPKLKNETKSRENRRKPKKAHGEDQGVKDNDLAQRAIEVSKDNVNK